MVPKVAAVLQETSCLSRRPVARCEARLTRPLTAAESERMREYPEFSISEDIATYSCRPEESEAAEKRLGAALRQSAEAAARSRRK